MDSEIRYLQAREAFWKDIDIADQDVEAGRVYSVDEAFALIESGALTFE